MALHFATIDAARDQAFSDQRALIRTLKDPVGFRHSSWRGTPLATYIHAVEGEFWLSARFPADLTYGTFVNPNAQLFSGASATLAPADLDDVAGIAITLLGGWADAEIKLRPLFRAWSRKLDIPVYVQLALENYPWHRRFWIHTQQKCIAVDRKLGDAICDTER